ncbi:MAG TPA: DUF4349 domain-containing protein [Anaerolineae bacterium]|nr:DUF4349 domain-containing protein [Anaerolineae bacterium]
MRKLNIKSAIIGIFIGLIFFSLGTVILNAVRPGAQGRRAVTSEVQQPTEAQVTPFKEYSLKDGQPTNGSLDEQLARGLPEGSEPGTEFRDGQSNSHSGSALTKLTMPALDEKIIRTANIELQVKKGKFNASYDRAVAIARSAGGFVSQSKSTATHGSVASGEIIMRIPAQDFEMVLSSLKRLGKVKAVDISSEDVSEEYVDLKSRLKHWRAQEAVMLDLMGKAKTISESITIQNNLSQIQMEIERISGRLNFLENRTSYATIQLYMAEPQVTVRADEWGLKTALRNALRASMGIVNSLIILVGYVLPLTLIVSVGYLLYRPVMNIVIARRRLQKIGE